MSVGALISNFMRFSVHVTYGWPWLGHLLTIMEYITYYDFVDDAMFSHNGVGVWSSTPGGSTSRRPLPRGCVCCWGEVCYSRCLVFVENYWRGAVDGHFSALRHLETWRTSTDIEIKIIILELICSENFFREVSLEVYFSQNANSLYSAPRRGPWFQCLQSYLLCRLFCFSACDTLGKRVDPFQQ